MSWMGRKRCLSTLLLILALSSGNSGQMARSGTKRSSPATGVVPSDDAETCNLTDLTITCRKIATTPPSAAMLAVGGRVRRDLLEFSLALHQENSEVRHCVQRREAGSRSQSYHCCSR